MDAKTLAIEGERLRDVVSAVTAKALVMPFPVCGRMEWLARALSMGQGERTRGGVSLGCG